MIDGDELDDFDPGAWHVVRTLHALELLAASPLSAPDVAAAIGAHPKTMRRVLERLMAEGYLEKRTVGKANIYRPTMRLVALAALTLENSDFVRRARPYVDLLHERTGAASHLVTPSYRWVVCVNHAASGEPEGRPHLRELVPTHCTAAGKVLIAHRGEWRAALLSGELPSFTDRTITDPDSLAATLEQVRIDGHAIEDGEYQPGVKAVAAPVIQDGEVVAAIGASGQRLDVDTVLPQVVRAARALNQDLADAEHR